MAAGFQVFVALPSGRKMVISIKPSNTIEHVKMLIQDKEGIPADQQRLVTTVGKELINDGLTVADYGVMRESTLTLTPKSRAPVQAEVQASHSGQKRPRDVEGGAFPSSDSLKQLWRSEDMHSDFHLEDVPASSSWYPV